MNVGINFAPRRLSLPYVIIYKESGFGFQTSIHVHGWWHAPAVSRRISLEPKKSNDGASAVMQRFSVSVKKKTAAANAALLERGTTSTDVLIQHRGTHITRDLTTAGCLVPVLCHVSHTSVDVGFNAFWSIGQKQQWGAEAEEGWKSGEQKARQPQGH